MTSLVNHISRPLAAAALVLCVAVAGCGGDDGGGDGGSAPKSITVALPGSGYAIYGWYAAEALGYFEDEGLDVELVATGGSSESAQLLAAGRADIAEANADQLMLAMEKVPVYPFYNFWEQEYRVWVVPEDSPIQSPDDLEGKTLGVTKLSGGEVPLVKSVLASDGILDDVEMVAVGTEPATLLSAFEEDRIQSYAGESRAVIALNSKGFRTRSILPTLLAKGPLVPTAAGPKLKGDRKTMVGVGRAVAKGSLFCLTNVKACVGAIKEKHPEFVPDEALAVKTLEEGYFPTTAPSKKGGKYAFGTTNTLAGWKELLRIYSAGDDPVVKEPDKIDLPALVQTGLVDAINDFDYAGVVKEAKSWKPQ